MESIIPLIIFIIFIATFSYFGPFFTNKPLQQASLSQTQEDVPQEQNKEKQGFISSSALPKVTTNSKPSFFIDTYITAGPEDGEIIEETNKVTFEFTAKILPEEIKEQIYFETKIEGFDDNWVRTYSKKRTITFPALSKEYTFLVRARTKNSFDLSPAKRNFQINISPYFEKVKIYSVKNKTSYGLSLITLSTTLTKEEKINITNWSLEGKEGKIIIPKAVEKYYHYYNSPQPEDIFVKKGDRIYLSSGFNPLGRNRNFRLNKCMGYLTASFDFPIPISMNCPKPKSEEITHLDPCCQKFIRYMRTCEIPDYSENPKIPSDSECISYLNENFNNVGCFRNYSQDEDFLKNEWHIYLNGKNIIVTNDCDIIYLRDQNGLLIDKYSYGYPVCW